MPIPRAFEAILAEHLTELASRFSKAYTLLADGVWAAGPADPELRRSVAEMIDALAAYEIPVKDGARAAAERIAKMDGERAAQAWRSWSRTVIAAQPSRPAMQIAANEFANWLAGTTPASHKAFLECLPAIAPSLADLRPAGVATLLTAANECTAPDDCRRVLAAVGAFGRFGKQVLIPVAQFLAGVAKAGDMAWVDPVEAIARSEAADEAHRFFGALPKYEQLPDAFGRQAWRPVLSLILAVGAQNCSSGEYLIGEIPKALRPMAEDLHEIYLADFRLLLESVGIRALAFGLSDLPHLYKQHGTEAVREFAGAAALAAEQYGKTAGGLFLERKTRAAKSMLKVSLP